MADIYSKNMCFRLMKHYSRLPRAIAMLAGRTFQRRTSLMILINLTVPDFCDDSVGEFNKAVLPLKENSEIEQPFKRFGLRIQRWKTGPVCVSGQPERYSVRSNQNGPSDLQLKCLIPRRAISIWTYGQHFKAMKASVLNVTFLELEVSGIHSYIELWLNWFSLDFTN